LIGTGWNYRSISNLFVPALIVGIICNFFDAVVFDSVIFMCNIKWVKNALNKTD